MGDQQPNAFQQQFEAIRQRFGKRLRDDYAALTQFRTSPLPPTPELVSIVHRLAGSAAMVGFTEIGEVAGRLDDAAVEPDADLSGLLRELLSALEKTISSS